MERNTDDLVSIIIPVYNVEQFLPQCVVSVLSQTHKNIEVILVDDGSTDSSGTICDEFARQDSRVRVVHKKNGGLSDARNTGIRLAAGAFLGFVDGDDWIEPDMYASLLSESKKEGADISIGGFFRDFVKNSVPCVFFERESLSGEEALYRLIDGREIQDHTCTKLFKTEIFDGGEFPCSQHYEDIRTVYKAFRRANRVCTVPKALYHYRQRKGSISSSGLNERKMEWLDAVKEQEACFFEKLQKDDRLKKCFERKTLYTKGCILYEWMLIPDRKVAKQYYNTAEMLYKDIRKSRRSMHDANAFPKTIRVISRLSFLPLSLVRLLFSNSYVRSRTNKMYEAY